MTAPSDGLIVRTLAPVIRVADRARSMTDLLAVGSLVSAAVIAGRVLLALWPPVFVVGAGAALLFLLLAVPAVVLFAFGYGIRSLSRLPDDLLETASAPLSPASGLVQSGGSKGPVRTVWRLARYLMRSRDVLFQLKGRLLEAGLLLRLFHPASLIAVLASVAATVVMAPVAGLILLLLML